MRLIRKRPNEPKELGQFRSAGGQKYDQIDFDKDILRVPLLEDQGYLCCYCMCRIDKDQMKIEHFRSQTTFPEKQLNWGNMLASCTGGQNQPLSQQTCDTRKGDTELSIDPLTSSVSRISYAPDGSIRCDDAVIQEDLDDRLNLNCESLRRNRVEAQRGLLKALEKGAGKRETWSRSKLKRKLDSLQENPKLPPFLGVMEYWLKKKIRQR